MAITIMNKKPLKLGILISGSGSTMERILEESNSGELLNLIDPVIVISNNKQAFGIKRAEKFKIPVECVDGNTSYLKNNLLQILRKYKLDLVSQNGWLPKTPLNVVDFYKERIINQHPGPLDPGRDLDFGGKGMYGSRVTCARLAFIWATGDNFWTEAVTHFVTKEYDKGKLIKVKKMKITPFDTRLTIKQIKNKSSLGTILINKTQETQKKLLKFEHQNVINTLKLFARGKVKGFYRSEPLVQEKYKNLLNESKKLAIELFPNG